MSEGPGSRVRRLLVQLVSWARFGKFASVGVIGAVCDTATLVILVEVFGVLEEVATLTGIEVAIIVMFLLNEHWTFSEVGGDGSGSKFRRLARSHLVRSGGSIVQFTVFVVIYRLLFVSLTVAGIDAWVIVAKVTGIGFGMVVNYTFESLFTWRIHHG